MSDEVIWAVEPADQERADLPETSRDYMLALEDRVAALERERDMALAHLRAFLDWTDKATDPGDECGYINGDSDKYPTSPGRDGWDDLLDIAGHTRRMLQQNSDEDDPLCMLVARFSTALYDKLVSAEKKYGYNNAWMREGWEVELRQHLLEHLYKGDPRDVAAYCAFAWWHGWSLCAPAAVASPFQSRVQPWLLACFGETIAGDRKERNHRLLEEALELVQACGCTRSEARQLVDYVFGRPPGEPRQEVGGVMVTLAALCLAHDLDMHQAGEGELVRVWARIDAIRAKQAAKPAHSPLPERS